MKGEYHLKSMNNDDELDLPSLTNITTTGDNTHSNYCDMMFEIKDRKIVINYCQQ